MRFVFDYLDRHPELWGYIIIPLVGWLLSIVAPPLAKRWPRLAPVLDWLLHKLPAAQGAYEKLRAARTPPKMPGAGLPTLMLVLCLAFVGCTPGEKQAVKTVLDVGNAVCAEVSPQTSQEYVDLICSAIGVADGASHIFMVRMRTIDARALASKTCPEKK